MERDVDIQTMTGKMENMGCMANMSKKWKRRRQNTLHMYVLCRSNRHSIASLAMGKRRIRHNNSNKILPRALLLALIAVVVRRYR
jgi:hypothetical protein